MATPSAQPARRGVAPADRRSARAEQRRSRILDAAAARFAAQGFAKTTVEEIAAHAGVSKGLVYARFPGKDELFDAVLLRTLDDWAEVARAEAARRGARSVREVLAIGFRVSLEFARQSPFLRSVLAQDPRVLLSGAREGIVRAAVLRYRARLVAQLRDGVAAGELREDLEVERSAEVIQLLNMAFIDRLFRPGSIDVYDERLIDATLEVIFHGIARGPRRGRRSSP
jgi:AcrR family transcriptional regulator